MVIKHSGKGKLFSLNPWLFEQPNVCLIGHFTHNKKRSSLLPFVFVCMSVCLSVIFLYVCLYGLLFVGPCIFKHLRKSTQWFGQEFWKINPIGNKKSSKFYDVKIQSYCKTKLNADI